MKGPYISQFLYKPAAYGALTLVQRFRTVIPERDYLTSYEDWLEVQNGSQTAADIFDETPRYVRNMRDLAQWVHMDALFETYLNAALVLLGHGAPYDAGNPYNHAKAVEGYATLGAPYMLGLVTDIADIALRAAWYNKWFVHRTLRPEEYGGLVHLTKTGKAHYPLHTDALETAALEEFHRRNGTYLLPQAFPEGCPGHPSYLAGHATVSGACATVLKAIFDEQTVVTDVVIPNEDGTELLAYKGPDADRLLVGGELNKLAMNVSVGRNMAGIHWRSDFMESLYLGESIAIAYLKQKKACLSEPHSYNLTKFDGTSITI
jgi:hypothetical protein